MTLMEIYDFIKFVGNKDYNGSYFAPDEYNSAIQVANLDNFKKEFGLPEQYKPGFPVSAQSADVNKKSMDRLGFLKVRNSSMTVTSGVMTLPVDFIYWDTLIYNFARTIHGTMTTLPKVVELLKPEQFTERRGNWIKKPMVWKPICTIVGDTVRIMPVEINSVEIYYWRMPVRPVFAYTITNDELVYNPGGSTEFEWPETCHPDIIRILLSYLGINLSSQEIIQYAEMQKEKGV